MGGSVAFAPCHNARNGDDDEVGEIFLVPLSLDVSKRRDFFSKFKRGRSPYISFTTDVIFDSSLSLLSSPPSLSLLDAQSEVTLQIFEKLFRFILWLSNSKKDVCNLLLHFDFVVQLLALPQLATLSQNDIGDDNDDDDNWICC